MKKKKIVFVYSTNRKSLAREVKKGISPDNGLYGLNYLSKLGYQTSFTDVSPKRQRLLDIILWPFDKVFKLQIDIGFQLGRALLFSPNINKVDAVVTNTDSIGLPVCFLKRLGLIKTPVIYAVGLFYIQGKLKEAVDSNKNTLFRYFYKWVLGAADHIIYHSPIEREKLVRLGLYNPAYCTFVAMGSDNDFFQKPIKRSDLPQGDQTLRGGYLVLAVGRDHTRDYKTLFEAAEKLPKIKFVVICSKRNIDKLKIPSNVEVLLDLSYKEVADWYQKAAVIAIPMKEMHRSSGQMTLTDSFQAGKAIVASNVAGISHYQLKNKSDVLLVSPESPEELAKAINLVLNDKLLKTTLEKSAVRLAQRFSTQNYALDISRVVDIVCDPIKLKPITTEDLEFLRRLRNENRRHFLDSNYIASPDQKKWFESYKNKNNDNMFILMNGKRKIGVGAIYHIDTKNKSAEIGRFVIDQKYRGQGYGKILLKKIEQIASGELNLKRLKLEVFADNKKAISLYEKSLFHKNGQRIIKDSSVVWMIKAI